MTSPPIPPNAYTDAPQQHPNLILGSLQLLFWIIFRPSAWRNHLKQIDPALEYKSEKKSQLRWRNPDLWRLLIQEYLILPFLIHLTVALVRWGLGESVEKIVLGLVWGLVLGLVWGLVLGLVRGLVWGLLWGLLWGLVSGLVSSGLVWGLLLGLASGLKSGLVLGLLSGLLSGLMWGLMWGLVSGLLSGLGVLFGATINLWRPLIFYPFLSLWHTLIYHLDKGRTNSQPSLLHWHSAFWDEWQLIPLIGLDKHLLLVIERNPIEGEAAINYLNNSRQRWAIQKVQIELEIRRLENCDNIAAIGNIHQDLATGKLASLARSILSSFSRISENINAALNQNSSYNQRLVLSEVAENLNRLSRELTSSSEKYAPRFYPIAKSWWEIVTNHIEELRQSVELRQEIDSPYIIAVPLIVQQDIFTGRTDISTRIEQLIIDRRRPPLLLYGQRRMGKTSLLNNLGRLLPNTIIPLFVDLQGAPASANNHIGFLYNIARGMIDSAKKQSAITLPPITREALETDPFTSFDEWLDKVEETLGQNTALLMLDEFEVLDNAIRKGRFEEQDILGMLRHIIQHRYRFKLLIAGSHTIEEYQRWASYLINVQILHISYLKEAEARKLIENPVPDFTLRYQPEAVTRVLQLTRCHPFLVQLLCEEIIVLKNEQDPSIRRYATLPDVEAAIQPALNSGAFFFADIQNNQITPTGLAILRFLAAKGEGGMVSQKDLFCQFPDGVEDAIDLLLRRELIEEVDDSYYFQVELIRRWFEQ